MVLTQRWTQRWRLHSAPVTLVKGAVTTGGRSGMTLTVVTCNKQKRLRCRGYIYSLRAPTLMKRPRCSCKSHQSCAAWRCDKSFLLPGSKCVLLPAGWPVSGPDGANPLCFSSGPLVSNSVFSQHQHLSLPTSPVLPHLFRPAAAMSVWRWRREAHRYRDSWQT